MIFYKTQENGEKTGFSRELQNIEKYETQELQLWKQ